MIETPHVGQRVRVTGRTSFRADRETAVGDIGEIVSFTRSTSGEGWVLQVEFPNGEVIRCRDDNFEPAVAAPAAPLEREVTVGDHDTYARDFPIGTKIRIPRTAGQYANRTGVVTRHDTDHSLKVDVEGANDYVFVWRNTPVTVLSRPDDVSAPDETGPDPRLEGFAAGLIAAHQKQFNWCADGTRAALARAGLPRDLPVLEGELAERLRATLEANRSSISAEAAASLKSFLPKRRVKKTVVVEVEVDEDQNDAAVRLEARRRITADSTDVRVTDA